MVSHLAEVSRGYCGNIEDEELTGIEGRRWSQRGLQTKEMVKFKGCVCVCEGGVEDEVQGPEGTH